MNDRTDGAPGLPDVGEDIYQQLVRTLGYEPSARAAGRSVPRALTDEPPAGPAQPSLEPAPFELLDDLDGVSPFHHLDDLAPLQEAAAPEDAEDPEDPQGPESPFGEVPLDELTFGAAPEEGTADLTAFRQAASAGSWAPEPPGGADGTSSAVAPAPPPPEGLDEAPARDRSAAEFYARLPDLPPFGAPR